MSASGGSGSGSAPGGLPASGRGRRRDEARSRSRRVVVRERGPADTMAGIIKKQILKHLSRSVGRHAPGRLRGLWGGGGTATAPGRAPPGGERPPGPAAGWGGPAFIQPAEGGAGAASSG